MEPAGVRRRLAIRSAWLADFVRARNSTTGTHPVVNIIFFELPKSPNLVPGHALARDPRVDGVLCYAEVLGDLIDGEPTVFHFLVLASRHDTGARPVIGHFNLPGPA